MTGKQNSTTPFVSLHSVSADSCGPNVKMTLRLDVHSGDRRIGSFDVERIDTTVLVGAGAVPRVDHMETTASGNGRAHRLTSDPSEWVKSGDSPVWFAAAVTEFIKECTTPRAAATA